MSHSIMKEINLNLNLNSHPPSPEMKILRFIVASSLTISYLTFAFYKLFATPEIKIEHIGQLGDSFAFFAVFALAYAVWLQQKEIANNAHLSARQVDTHLISCLLEISKNESEKAINDVEFYENMVKNDKRDCDDLVDSMKYAAKERKELLDSERKNISGKAWQDRYYEITGLYRIRLEQLKDSADSALAGYQKALDLKAENHKKISDYKIYKKKAKQIIEEISEEMDGFKKT